MDTGAEIWYRVVASFSIRSDGLVVVVGVTALSLFHVLTCTLSDRKAIQPVESRRQCILEYLGQIWGIAGKESQLYKTQN